MRNFALGATLAVVAASAAHAQVSDDFNRPDAGTLGSNWIQQAGSASISSNQAVGTGGAETPSLATYIGSSGNSVSFDLFSGGPGLQYGAAVLGWNGGNDNYFIKVQSNNSSSGFDSFGFYRGNNDGGYFGFLSAPFTQASVTASFVGTLATLTIDPLSGPQQVYTHDYGLAPGGTTNGLGFYGIARLDNFSSGGLGAVPEPATWMMMIFGFGMVGGTMRMQKRREKVIVHDA